MRDILEIRTPENVAFEFELAGVATRATAWVMDAAVMGAAIFVVALVVGLFGIFLGGFAMAVQFVLIFVVQWGYGTLLEWAWGGQTLGKRIVGIRVLSQGGTRLTFVQSVVRNLVRVVDLLPALYGVGAVSALVDGRGRRLGDLAAGSVVVRVRRSPRPSAVMASVDRYNSFVNDPAVIHASSRITPPERDAMVGLSIRRENLPLPVRYALFGKLACHLERRLGIARPDFFSEERFVLNLTAVVLGLSRDPRHAASTELDTP